MSATVPVPPDRTDRIDVLVVDDRREQLVALSAVLEDLDVRVHVATSGREALRLLLRRDFAVILLDVNMPGMDGFELAQLVRERPRSADTPIIFVSAATEYDTHVSRGYSLGAVDYIHVPVVPDILRTKVSVFVDLYRKTLEIHRNGESLRRLEAREHRRQLSEALERLEHEARQVELLREEQRRAVNIERLTSAALVINAARSVEETLEAVASELRALLETSRACIWIRGEGSTAARCAVAPAPPQGALAPDPAVSVLHARVAEVNRVLRLDAAELAAHAVLGPLVERMPEPDRPAAWLSVPLAGRDGRNLGFVLALGTAGAPPFAVEDEALAARLGDLAAVAIENLLYREAREANRLKDEFLAMLSHELRTPLSAMLGWTQLLRSGRLDADRSARALEVVERNLKMQAQLIEDLLDMSRIVNGKLRLEPAVRPLGAIIDAAVDGLRPSIEARDVRLEVVRLDADACVWGDAARLQQVVLNLLSNANKFTPEGGGIELELRRDGATAEILVRDTGEGIDPELLPFVFDRFTQEESSLTRSHGGLGLGLTIAKHLVEMHGGTISAASAGKGRGSCFTIRLPVLDGVPVASTAASSGTDEPVSLAGIRVLLVEDDADTREMVATTLASFGADVVAAASPAEAMREFEHRPPRVLVCDIAMPGEDGYTFMRRVRGRPAAAGGTVPAIALTAFADPRSRSAALQAGYQIHLTKPVDQVQLAMATAALAASLPIRRDEPATDARTPAGDRAPA